MAAIHSVEETCLQLKHLDLNLWNEYYELHSKHWQRNDNGVYADSSIEQAPLSLEKSKDAKMIVEPLKPKKGNEKDPSLEVFIYSFVLNIVVSVISIVGQRESEAW